MAAVRRGEEELTAETRREIVHGIAQALAEIYFSEVVEPKPTSEDLLNTAARMRAIHEAVNTAGALLGILDKAADFGAAEDGETGVIVLPEVMHDPAE